MKEILFEDLGTKDYKETWDYQEELFDAIIQIKRKKRKEDLEIETPNHFFICRTSTCIYFGQKW